MAAFEDHPIAVVGAIPLSVILQVRLQNRQKAAHETACVQTRLATLPSWCTVDVAEGAPLAAPFVYHLFRTLSLSGQVRGTSRNLPAFFECNDLILNRQRSAQDSCIAACLLRNGLDGSLTDASESLTKEGWAGCEQYGLPRQLDCVRAWWPAATRRPNRCFMAAGPAWSPRHCWMATSLRGPLLGRQPMSSIVRKTPANARRGLTRPTRINRSDIRPTRELRNAITGLRARGGVLRLEHQVQRTAHV
jgi:hypothetical protein